MKAPTCPLARYLARHGLTARDFADMVGCSAGTMSKILSGKSYGHAETLRGIHRATGGAITPNDIFGLSRHAGAV